MSALATLASDMRGCRACFLADRRTQAVTWRGTAQPGVVLFIGEAPGAEEDRAGVPFVGAAGRLLQEWIEGPLGLAADEYLLANAVACYPHDPAGRPVPPPLHCADACSPFLARLIAEVRPNPIVALGRHAERSLERLGITDFVFCYHPSYYLRGGHGMEEDVQELAVAVRRARGGVA